jgi:hypothetical protein
MSLKKVMEEAYEQEIAGNWGMEAHLFNPEALPLSKVLLAPQVLHRGGKDPVVTPALGYEELFIDDVRYWIPNYYGVKRSFITGCPECPKPSDAALARLSIELWQSALEERSKSRLAAIK